MNYKYNRKLNESVKNAIRRVILKEANMGLGSMDQQSYGTEQPNSVQPRLSGEDNPFLPKPGYDPGQVAPGYPGPRNKQGMPIGPDGYNGPGSGTRQGSDGLWYWYAPGLNYPYFYWNPDGGYPPGTGAWDPIMM